MRQHLRRMARYNRWANERLYAACGQLPAEEYHRARQAFFGSIHGTLSHVLVGDRMWLARIEGAPPPDLRLDDQPYGSLQELGAARAAEDRRIIERIDATHEEAVAEPVRYRTVVRPEAVETPLHLCWLHVFNHQTHHRGQAHDQLSQTTIPPPPLDLIYYLRENE